MKLYVGNLPFSTTDLELKDTFQEWGYAVVEAKVIMDRDTGKSRGFGFVTLDAKVDGKVIEAVDGRDLGGRQLTINEAKQQEPRRGGGGGGGGGRGGYGGRDTRGGGGGRGNRGNNRGNDRRGGHEERSTKGFWDGEK